MKCANCPLFTWWNNESDKGESCGLFGDSWDNRFQYEDKDGNIVGCYITIIQNVYCPINQTVLNDACKIVREKLNLPESRTIIPLSFQRYEAD